MVIREPHPLRDYQIAAVAEAERRNIICVLPTNSGKTVIAAALIEKMLRKENSEGGLARKMLFVVTTRELAVQQKRVLCEQIPMLKTDENPTAGDNAAWRLGLLVGIGSDEADAGTRSSTFFQHTQVCVVIEAKLEDALVHGYLQMEDVALLVMDEAHHARGNSSYATIAKYFYAPCERRPRVLALTASPVEAAAGTPTSEADFQMKLAALETDLNAAAWARVVDREHCPNAEPSVLEHAPSEEWVRMSDETACFAYRALCDAKPKLAEATERGLSHTEATEFLEAWDKCVKRAVEVSEPFGAWALDWCARMFEDDLSRGARRLSWYDKPMDEEDERQKFVGGTDAHAYLLSAAQTKLKQQLRTRAKALPEAAVGGKLHTLIEYLLTRAPRKCLIFVQQRVSCPLLVDAIKALLGESVGAHRIDWVCRPGRVGVSPSGPGSSTYSEGQLGQALGAFRADLRILVSTSILEEGIDVPECDAVIDFDGATSTRQGQQRKGRARAKNASYAYLVASDKAPELRRNYENVRRMNEMTVERIARRSERPSPQMLSAKEARMRIARECVRTKGPDGRACALLPIERCKTLLDHVYYVQKFHLQPGAPGFELDLSADGTHFTSKEKGANNFQMIPIKQPTGETLFSCALHLPGVLLCSAEVGAQLPMWLPPTNPYRAKKDAIAHAALEGVEYLLSIGVLNAHLQVSRRRRLLPHHCLCTRALACSLTPAAAAC
jgi:ERCC4-related helicase